MTPDEFAERLAALIAEARTAGLPDEAIAAGPDEAAGALEAGLSDGAA